MKLNGLFIGLNTIDVQFFIDKYPEKNKKNKAKDYGIYTGGPATNASIVFAHLNGKSNLISSFGKNLFTGHIFHELKNYNVEYTDIAPERTCEPLIASVVTNIKNGNRSVISYHPENKDNCDISLELIDLNNYDIILADTFYIDTAKRIIKNKNPSTPVVMDGGSWKNNLEEVLPLIDIAICSSDFYPPLCKTTDQVFEFLTNAGIEYIAITRGENSILVKEKSLFAEIPVKKIDAKDTMGAGDFFHGAFCYYYAQNNDFKNSLLKASVLATKSCLHYGTRSWLNSV